MRDPIESWRNQDVQVVIVGNGSREFAEDFRKEFDLEGLLLVDPELHAYRAAGLRRGRRELASPQLIGNAIRALRSGARQTGVLGDPWQLGGVFVFAPGGDLRFRHLSASAGDHATPEEIEAALDESAEIVNEEAASASAMGTAIDALRPVFDASPFLSFDRIGYERHSLGYDPSDLDVDLYGRRCVVSGDSVGLEYETALALADLGAEVVLLGRDREGAEHSASQIRDATGNRRVLALEIELADRASIDAVATELRKSPVDVLVHGFDAFLPEREATDAGLELSYARHVLGPHRLTSALASALEASDDARVVWVSSSAMLTRKLNLEDPNWIERDYDAAAAYSETKRAQVVLAELWAEAFNGTSVHVNSMHPGWVDDAVVRNAMPRVRNLTKVLLRSPAEGADTAIWLAASPAAEGLTGRFFFDRKSVRAHWVGATRESREDRDRLWEMCEAPESWR